MDTVFGNTQIVGQAKITRADGTVEVVDISEDLLESEPSLIQRLLAHLQKED